MSTTAPITRSDIVNIIGLTHGDIDHLQSLLSWLVDMTDADDLYDLTVHWSLSPELGVQDIAIRLRTLEEKHVLLDAFAREYSEMSWNTAYMQFVRSALMVRISKLPASLAHCQHVDEMHTLVDSLIPPHVSVRPVVYSAQDLLNQAIQHSVSVPCGPFASYIGLNVERGNLITIGARPAVGKSALALKIAVERALAGHRTHYVSLEMTARQLGVRLASVRYHLPLDQVDVPSLYNALGDAQLGVVSDFLSVYPTSGSIQHVLREPLRDIKEGDVIVLDHLHLVDLPRDRSRPESLGEVTRYLKQLALDTDCVIIMLAQLGRGSDQAPTMADLRWSGSIETDSDAILFLHLDGYNTVATVAKHRQGSNSVVRLSPNWQYVTTWDYAGSYPDSEEVLTEYLDTSHTSRRS